MSRKPVAQKKARGQSFVEIAIALPILLLLLAGMLEVGFLFYAYMTAVDQTREASRFGSTRSYKELNGTIDPTDPAGACHDGMLHYYYDVACFFTDSDINPSLPISSTRFEDVTISLFTIQDHAVAARYPNGAANEGGSGSTPGVWSLYNDNWRRDCEGNIILSEPYFTNAEIVAMLQPEPAPPEDPIDRGLILVEVFVCYQQKMGLLNFRSMERLIPDPMRLHAYTIMPAPEALPEP